MELLPLPSSSSPPSSVCRGTPPGRTERVSGRRGGPQTTPGCMSKGNLEGLVLLCLAGAVFLSFLREFSVDAPR